MSEHGPTEILRRPDGSIDIDAYTARANLARRDAWNDVLRTGARLLTTLIGAVARRFASSWIASARGTPRSLT